MKRCIKIIIGSLFILFLMLGLGYLGLSVYYENGFSIQTYINGIYCTGKSVGSVNQELSDAYEYAGLTVKIKDVDFFINVDDIDYTYDFINPLNEYLQQQNPYLWMDNLFCASNEYKMLPEVSYNEVKLEKIITKEIEKMNLPQEPSVFLATGEEGFYLVNEKEKVLDEQKVTEVIENALRNGSSLICLEETEACFDEPFTKEEEEMMAFYDLLEGYQTREVIYHFGEEKEKLAAGEIAKTLRCYTFFEEKKNRLPDTWERDFLDENKKLKTDKEATESVLEVLFKPYNTYRNHTFQTHDGRELVIKGGTYGNQINLGKETNELMDFLMSDMQLYDREPEYTREALYKGKDDIGDTYIEVDIGQQKMFYYRDGELYLETDVVTGKNKATREEVCYVYGKQKDRILRGPGYASPVKYWMPVSGGIGIHDASWRSEYGGDIYIRNGSHGCINTPLEMVEKLYEVVEVGTPCILYYGID